MSQDHYETLGVARDADQAEIRKAYRRLAKDLHPDINKDDPEAEEKYKSLSEAYAVLSDSERRAKYDQPAPSFMGNQFANVISQIFIHQHPQAPRQNPPIRIGVRISAADLLRETGRTIPFTRATLCPDCGGTGGEWDTCSNCAGRGTVSFGGGQLFGQMTCNACGGHGRTIKEPCSRCHGDTVVGEDVEVAVTIPPGFNAGKFNINGRGHQQISDVPPGRVILEPIIDAGGAKVNGADLVMMNVGEDPVSFLMGDSFDLETPTGETVSVQIPEGSSFGLTVTVPGKGLPLIFGAAEPRGNLILRLIPEFPGNMTEEQAEMLRVYAVSRGIGNAGGFDLVQEADKA